MTNNDIGNTVNIFLTYGLFVSSVIFKMPSDGLIGKINQINLFNHFIIGLRDFTLFGYINNPTFFILSSLISILVLCLAIRYQHRMEYIVRELA